MESAPHARWSRYLAQLPGGVDAYPRCACKASVTRQFYAHFGSPRLADDVPAAVRELATNPPAPSAFVSEVVSRLLYLATGDALALDDDTLVARSLEVNRALMSDPLHRAMFFFVSPERAVANAASRWAAFHRGIDLSAMIDGPKRFVGTMKAPPLLDTTLLVRLFMTSFEAGLEAAGAKDVELVVSEASDGVTQVRGRWR